MTQLLSCPYYVRLKLTQATSVRCSESPPTPTPTTPTSHPPVPKVCLQFLMTMWTMSYIGCKWRSGRTLATELDDRKKMTRQGDLAQYIFFKVVVGGGG